QLLLVSRFSRTGLNIPRPTLVSHSETLFSRLRASRAGVSLGDARCAILAATTYNHACPSPFAQPPPPTPPPPARSASTPSRPSAARTTSLPTSPAPSSPSAS